MDTFGTSLLSIVLFRKLFCTGCIYNGTFRLLFVQRFRNVHYRRFHCINNKKFPSQLHVCIFMIVRFPAKNQMIQSFYTFLRLPEDRSLIRPRFLYALSKTGIAISEAMCSGVSKMNWYCYQHSKFMNPLSFQLISFFHRLLILIGIVMF